MQQIPKVFQPWRIGGMDLMNRVVMAPMTRRKCETGQAIPSEAAEYYAGRAAGGIGLIITEGCHINNVDAVDVPNSSIPQCKTPDQIAAWKNMVDAVKDASGGKTKMCMQLWHAGTTGPTPIGPSANLPKGVATKEATEEDIDRIVDDYAQTAFNAVKLCGFDAVEVHGAHGYFIDSFASPTLNVRKDAYGGSVSGRAQLAKRVVSAVREALGPDVPILFRFSQWVVYDYPHVKFHNSKELEIFLKEVGGAGVDAFHVSTRRVTDPGFPEEDPKLTLAGWTQRVSGVPTIGVGSVTLARMFGESGKEDTFSVMDPEPSLNLVESGEFDGLAVGRALLSDPEWVKKVSAGKWKELIPYDGGR